MTVEEADTRHRDMADDDRNMEVLVVLGER